jgi:hypothetical protein
MATCLERTGVPPGPACWERNSHVEPAAVIKLAGSMAPNKRQ